MHFRIKPYTHLLLANNPSTVLIEIDFPPTCYNYLQQLGDKTECESNLSGIYGNRYTTPVYCIVGNFEGKLFMDLIQKTDFCTWL